MLEKYHDLKWNPSLVPSKYFHSGKAGASKDGKLSPPVRVEGVPGGAAAAGLHVCPGESRRCGFAITSSTCTAATPPRSSWGWAWETPRCTSQTNQSPAQVNALAGSQTWPDPLGQISEPGSCRAQGSRPAASQAHLHSPGSPSWALGLLPPPTHSQGHPFPEPLEAATPHITSFPPRPSSFVGSEPTTHSQARSDEKSSFWDRWLAGRQSFALSVGSNIFPHPLQWLWSCFHGNRAWWTLFSLPIYIVRNKTLLV